MHMPNKALENTYSGIRSASLATSFILPTLLVNPALRVIENSQVLHVPAIPL